MPVLPERPQPLSVEVKPYTDDLTGPKTTHVGAIRDRIGAKRGRNIGVVAAARWLEYVFYALRDGHVRALGTQAPAAALPPPRQDLVGAGRAGHDPRTGVVARF